MQGKCADLQAECGKSLLIRHGVRRDRLLERLDQPDQRLPGAEAAGLPAELDPQHAVLEVD
jgi:hypothetical protein